MSKYTHSLPTIFLSLFLLFSLGNLIALATETPIDNYITKPCLMIWLGLYAYFRQGESLTSSDKWLLFGLFFSFGGDSLLLFADGRPGGETFFLLGLSSFLLTHLAYWMAFHKWPNQKTGLLSRRPLLLLPFVAYWAGMIYLLWPGMPPAMRIPVLVYSMVITVMAAKALHISPNLSVDKRWMLLAGVLLFVISDSIIALSRFTDLLPFSILAIGMAIMVTYLGGQLLIVMGLTRKSV
ncbi:MAG: hypothetical protein DHS20C18_47180 [Saprospiraceae bacterium]|nr:MAG: hypothetical protein DHS20C18_47180 [Saprospiraceae bacterium]